MDGETTHGWRKDLRDVFYRFLPRFHHLSSATAASSPERGREAAPRGRAGQDGPERLWGALPRPALLRGRSRLPGRGVGERERHRGDPGGDTGPPGATRTPQHGRRGRGHGDNVAEGHHEPSREPRGPGGDTGGEPKPSLLGRLSPVLVPRHLRGAGPARALCHLPEDQGQRDPGQGHGRQRLLRSGGSGPAPRPRPHPKNPGAHRDPLGPARPSPAPAGLAPGRLLRVPGWPQGLPGPPRGHEATPRPLRRPLHEEQHKKWDFIPKFLGISLPGHAAPSGVFLRVFWGGSGGFGAGMSTGGAGH